MHDLAKIVMVRIEALGKISDEEGKLTRTFCSSAMRRGNNLVASWMREAGMDVRKDAIGNVIGYYPAKESPKSKVQSPKSSERMLLLGSHLDTVRDAGKCDGPLGVLVAIACVQHLHDTGTRLPFAIEVAGFADEEGVRYQSTYLGSRALAGIFNLKDLNRLDANGIAMAEAIRSFGGNPDALSAAKLDRKKLLGYVEVHIEQGPILEERNLSVAIVSAISGQARYECSFFGRAGHAGTVPMKMRSDALCAAAEFVLAVEHCAKSRPGLVATVGRIEALPGASNVIPGKVTLTLDVRHAEDSVRNRAGVRLKQQAMQIAKRRKIQARVEMRHEAKSIMCDRRFSRMLDDIVKRHQGKSLLLPSGAGHDAVAMAAITPVAMLFVRCKGGVSHHPDESVSVKDVRMAIVVMNDFLRELGRKHQ